ncbi:hypothetical protein M9H77_33819 [Catharanthus roseus]|uniref:Uncharacterized protein n=1 Tax=Catharanthus roseus TaxID=4058 RepID=A0ACB9ZKB0_CATRO|nr:hypothetical protein M9H77_33819 [Catharanthus roseus]
MVRPIGRRGDDDLGPVMDKTGRVEGRTVTASSRGVRGRHSTSDLPVTPTPLTPGFNRGTGEAGNSTQPSAIPFRSRPLLQPHLSHTPVSYEPYGFAHPPSHPTGTVYDQYLHAPTTIGFLRMIGLLVRSKKEFDPYIFRDRRMREVMMMVIVVMMMVMVVMIIMMRVMMMEIRSRPYIKIAESRNKRREVARDVPAPTQKRKKDRVLLKCRSRYMALTGWDLTDSQARPLASGSGVDIFVFSMFAPPFRHSFEGCKPYIQMFLTIGCKNENKLLDIRLRLDMMTADEVRWIPYRTQNIRDCWVSTRHGFTACFDCSCTSVPTILASSCTDDYMDWYLPRTHPRIQNPGNILSGYNVPVAPAIVIDMILMVMSLDIRFEIY